MNNFREKIRWWLLAPSRGLTFILFAALVTVLVVGWMSFIHTSDQQQSTAEQHLSRQSSLIHEAAIVARDLALAESGRAALRQQLASLATDLVAVSANDRSDLSLDSQLRVFVARLRALSKGNEARLSASDPRLKGLTEAVKGSLGQGFKIRIAALAIHANETKAEAQKQILLLLILAMGFVVLVGTTLIAKSAPAIMPHRVARRDINPIDAKPIDSNALLSALDGLDQGVALFDGNDALMFHTPRLGQIFSGVLVPGNGSSYESFVRQILAATESETSPDSEDNNSSNLDEMLSQRLTQPHGNTYQDFLPDGRCLELAEYSTSLGGRIVLARDVTEAERRKAVQKLGDSRTAAIVDTVFDGIIMINDEGEVETFNPAAEKIFGYAASDVIGQNVSILMPEGHANSHDGYLRRYLDGGVPKVIGAITELQGKRKDGQLFPLEIAVNEVDATWILQERRRTPRRVFIATLRDITGQKALARQLQQSQKMEAIGTLAGGIAHDFNNILSIILGFTGLTLEDDKIDEDGRENLDTVLTAAFRARDLVQQILTFSRKGDQEKLRVSLQTVLADALKMLRSTFPANVEMRTDIDPRDLVVLADPTQMHQVLMNLCTNAGQAMPRGGILEVKLQRVQIDGKSLETFDMQGNGSCVRLMVRDTGIGMDAATLERVFEPFYTTKPLGSGTGLGLSVVHGIVKEHGGHIAVESAAGAGTTFTMLLPLAGQGEPVPEIEVEPAPRGSGRILVVDDEPAVVRMAEKLLTRLGYDVVGHDSSVEALRLFREQPDQFDLVITDHSMPDMTGDVLAKELRRIRPTIPIVICTGYSADFTQESAKIAGIDGYILKPSMPAELGHVVSDILTGNRA
ncbi:MAG: response regulator [Alphaproteobacteria bacterium]|jgi:PAS domain S-box-containing protein|nr:response regulator [Alphaproteobacteria bacterium]